jgi:alkanesulfonate monooxygenase SsuD/methylene tetrahydromethanopterin reductase-like flavin-dependent oxidoreductase (luciferase family)
LNLRRGKPGQLAPPDPELDQRMTAQERALLAETLSCSAIGGPERISRELDAFVARTGADEIMVTAQVYDHAARLRSFEIAAAAQARV